MDIRSTKHGVTQAVVQVRLSCHRFGLIFMESIATVNNDILKLLLHFNFSHLPMFKGIHFKTF